MNDETNVDETAGYRPLTAEDIETTFPGYEGQLVDSVTYPPQEGKTVETATVFRPELARRVPFDGLYEHQAEAIERLQAGENVVVSTSTASGKTYIYALYFAWLKRTNPEATALFTYPTKALAGDQERELNDLYDELSLEIRVERYDGDTPSSRRRDIRENADIVLTNFAATNVYLHDHMLWRTLYRNCQLLVVDEAHSYTGIQGMHVAWICRRLERILSHYGSDPQLVCSSATIGNPVEHAQGLTGQSFELVDNDTSPRGQREILFWDPPVDEPAAVEGDVDPMAIAESKRSANSEAGELLAHLGLNDVQTLLFVRSRQGTEVTAKQTMGAASDHPATGNLSVQPYHAGHGKETRRGTENQLKSGRLDGVISTNALELGIDIGSVDSAILSGYPGSRQSFWQQLGRAGRGQSNALATLIARSDAIDQYVLDNPEYLLEDDVEDAVVDLQNNVVYANHLLCAADEKPLTAADSEWFGDDRLDKAVQMWKDAGKFVGALDRGVQYDGSPRPQGDVDMYATGGQQFEVRCSEEGHKMDITDIHRERAYRDYHPGALVLHDGVQYEVTDLDEQSPNPSITVDPVSTNEYTRTQHTKQVSDVEPQEVQNLGGGFEIGFGMGTVSIHYDTFTRHEIGSGKMVGMPEPLELPPIELRTQLLRVRTPPELLMDVLEAVPPADLLDSPADLSQGDKEYTFLGGLHGAEHAMIKLAPLELNMSKDDLGGLSLLNHPETGGPTWFIHDTVEGGIGFARAIYEACEAVMARTDERVSACDCSVRGCPSCLMDHQCGNRNEPLHTTATSEILRAVLDRF